MSWETNGRTYHSYSEYEEALNGGREQRLRSLVNQLRIPDADSASVERRLATAHAQRKVVERAMRQADRDIARIEEDTRGLSTDARESFSAIRNKQLRVREDMKRSFRELDQQVDGIEAERVYQLRYVDAKVADEERHEAASLAEQKERTAQLLASAANALAVISNDRAVELGLDLDVVRSLRARANAVSDAEAIVIAREASDMARELVAEFRWREARIEALREALQAEVMVLRQLLEFSDEDRKELVGTGDSALDVPLWRELKRIEAEIPQVRLYDSVDQRFDDIARALDEISPRIVELTSQVKNFDKLDTARFNLVRNNLASELSEVIGEPLKKVGERPGVLGLQPIEVHFETMGGEKVDCLVGIDSSLHIHHHGHADQRTCAEAAKRLAAAIPRLIKMNAQPTLDVHRGAATSGTVASDKATKKQVK
ncbi:MAG: hypothetical protein WC815_04070 [Vicinamibacterales bacterium]|jgi:hypothetical protein